MNKDGHVGTAETKEPPFEPMGQREALTQPSDQASGKVRVKQQRHLVVRFVNRTSVRTGDRKRGRGGGEDGGPQSLLSFQED